MSDEKLKRLLNLALLSDDSDRINDETLNLIFSRMEKYPPEKLNRMQKLFVEKLFREKYPNPVTKIEKKITFGAWIQEKRRSLNLTSFDIANALELKESFIENLEVSRTHLWDFSPGLTVNFMNLYRIHFNAIKELILTSDSVNQSSGTGMVYARSRKGRMSSPRGDSTSRALESFLANNTSDTEISAEVCQWLESLKAILNNSEQTDLIKNKTEG